MEIKDRLQQYISLKSISLRELERQCSISNGVLGRLNKSTSPKTLKRIEDNTDINLHWLLTGEGEMLKEVEAEKEGENTKDENQDGYQRKRGKMIPFYDAETTGGYMGAVSSSSEEVHLAGYINAGDWFDGRETAAIRHVGDSMSEYPNGCILAVREVRNRNLLVPGRNYVIETDEYRITKRVQLGSSRDTIALYSTNKERYADGRLIYEPFEISLEDVRRIFTVLGYIVNQQGETHLSRL